MPCEAGADLGIKFDDLREVSQEYEDEVRSWDSIPTAVGAGAEKEVIMIIVVESFLDDVIAGSKAPDHVAKFCH